MSEPSSGPSTPPGAEAAISGRRALLFSAALLVVSLAVAAVVGEIAVRRFAPQQLITIRPDIWEAVDTVGWFKRPNVNADINTGERWAHIATDREGFRVGRQGRLEASTTILLLGDSFMEALQVEYEQSFAGLLETSLPARIGRPVAVRDAGVAGWDPPQYYLLERQLLARDTFDLVLVSLYRTVEVRPDRIPPRAPTIRHHLRFPQRPTWREFVDAVLYPINDLLKYHSHLFVLLKSRIQTLRMRTGLTEADVPRRVLLSEAGSPAWTVTAGICRDIAALAQAHGARAIFMLVPAPYQVDTATLSQYKRGFALGAVDPDQPNRLLGAALRAEGLTLVDPLPAFRAASAAGTRLYGKLDPHLTPAGHQLLEHFVEPVLVSALTVPPAHGSANGRRPGPVLHPTASR
jgi:hypothetical protein